MLRSLIVVALAGSALAGADSFAQGQAIVGIQSTTQYSLEGRIAAVDVNARTVTITSAGTNRMLNVSPMAANISSTRVGENVVLAVEDTRTFVLSGSNTPTPAPGSASTTGAVETNQGVAGARISNSLANWWVVSVDPAANTITLVQSRWRRSAHL